MADLSATNEFLGRQIEHNRNRRTVFTHQKTSSAYAVFQLCNPVSTSPRAFQLLIYLGTYLVNYLICISSIVTLNITATSLISGATETENSTTG